jgi:hypothetical protein
MSVVEAMLAGAALVEVVVVLVLVNIVLAAAVVEV